MELIVGMGDYGLSDRRDAVIRTFALGTCVAVTAYSPAQRAAGMVHVVLPFPLDSRDGAERPARFASTGVPLLVGAMCTRYGCQPEELTIQLYGGADAMPGPDVYRVGQKNIDAVKRALLGMGLTIHRADLRGNLSRSLAMQVNTGSVAVFRQPIPTSRR
ncbi:MAG: chemotaxis protein CheD [Clostridiales bacterium]|nr:chemotaxis protein CheD [Clostridiales bacterium]